MKTLGWFQFGYSEANYFCFRRNANASKAPITGSLDGDPCNIQRTANNEINKLRTNEEQNLNKNCFWPFGRTINKWKNVLVFAENSEAMRYAMALLPLRIVLWSCHLICVFDIFRDFVCGHFSLMSTDFLIHWQDVDFLQPNISSVESQHWIVTSFVCICRIRSNAIECRLLWFRSHSTHHGPHHKQMNEINFLCEEEKQNIKNCENVNQIRRCILLVAIDVCVLCFLWLISCA